MRIRYSDVFARTRWERVIRKDSHQDTLNMACFIPRNGSYIHWAITRTPIITAYLYTSSNKELPPSALVPENAVLHPRAYSRGQGGQIRIPEHVRLPLTLDVGDKIIIQKVGEAEGYTKYEVTPEASFKLTYDGGPDAELIG